MSDTTAELAPTVVTARRIAPRDDIPRLRIGDRDFEAWKEIKVTRGLDRLAGDFALRIAEARAPRDADRPFAIRVFDPCEIRLGEDLVLTGHVDAVLPAMDRDQHEILVLGRSRTADLVDCQIEIEGGEFRNADLGAIARAICAPFGIAVVVEAPLGEPFDIAAFERTETAFDFLERLARQRGVLLTDDAAGRLVIARAGETVAQGRVVQGENLLAAIGELNGAKRFSRYVILSQLGSLSARVPLPFDAGQPEPEPPGGEAQPGILGLALDRDVSRYRPRVAMAEQALTAPQAEARALWQAAHAAGRGIRGRLTVPGWRQEDGAPWAVNQRLPCRVPWLRLDGDLLIASVSFTLTERWGRRTVLEVGPVQGFTPEPLAEERGGAAGGGRQNWAADGITRGAGRL